MQPVKGVAVAIIGDEQNPEDIMLELIIFIRSIQDGI